MKQRDDYQDCKVAIANSASAGAISATAINTTGYGRARFVFHLGGTAGTGSVGAIGVYKAATSGAAYSLVTALGAKTSGLLSGGVTAIVDVATDPTYPWLKASGTFTLEAVYHGATVDLYNGMNVTANTSSNQVVVA